MKLKKTLIVASALVAGALTSNAATYSLFNVAGGPGTDTLWANLDGSLMNGSGFVTMGYFATNPLTTDIDTIAELVALKSTFTAVQTATPGLSVAFTAAGFLAEEPAVVSSITGSNALIGRKLYAIASNASSLAAATALNAFSLFEVATIVDDVPFEQNYVANPAGSTVIIGELGAYEDAGNAFGLGAGTYTTLKLVGVPEPSAALLGAFGVLGLLRRRRI
jgi:hypothetical protein